MSEVSKRDRPGGLRVSVDLNRCQAYAKVERARLACPVQAIRLESTGAIGE